MAEFCSKCSPYDDENRNLFIAVLENKEIVLKPIKNEYLNVESTPKSPQIKKVSFGDIFIFIN